MGKVVGLLKYKSVRGHSAAGRSYFVILFILKVMVRARYNARDGFCTFFSFPCVVYFHLNDKVTQPSAPLLLAYILRIANMDRMTKIYLIVLD